MRIGILGGGQLGRMMALAGYPLGMRFRFFDPSPVATAGQVGELISAQYDDMDALRRFASGLDVITFEFENVPAEVAQQLEHLVPVRPGPNALEIAQDRLSEKRFFQKLGFDVPTFAAVDTRSGLRDALKEIGLPAVLKTRREGYDGKGQAVIRQWSEVDTAWDKVTGPGLILEAFVPFERELSIIGVRGLNGSVRTWPLVENEHRDGILARTIAPAPTLTPQLQELADSCITAAMNELDYVGVLAIELFQVDGNLLINEMAPRVHNSGHWTLDGAETSQFENHLRAIAGLPPGSTEPTGSSMMLNLIGAVPNRRDLLAIDGLHLHLYGKEPRPGRKLGHVTICAPTPTALESRLASFVDRLH